MTETFSCVVIHRGPIQQLLAAVSSLEQFQEAAPTQLVLYLDGYSKSVAQCLEETLASMSFDSTSVTASARKGRGEARRAALLRADGDILALQDSDDYSLPGRAADAQSLLSLGHDAVSCQMVAVDPSLQQAWTLPLLATRVSHSTLVFRRSMLPAFDYPRWPIAEDQPVLAALEAFTSVEVSAKAGYMYRIPNRLQIRKFAQSHLQVLMSRRRDWHDATEDLVDRRRNALGGLIASPLVNFRSSLSLRNRRPNTIEHRENLSEWRKLEQAWQCRLNRTAS